MFMSGQEIYNNFASSPGAHGLAEGAAGMNEVVKTYHERSDRIKKIVAKMEATWRGDAAGAAQRGLGPLAVEHGLAAPAMNTAQDLANRQAGSFGDAKNTVKPVPPAPQRPDPWSMITSREMTSTYAGQMAAHNAAAKNNADVMRGYENASIYNMGMPDSYGSFTGDESGIKIADPTTPQGPGDGLTQPGPGTAGPRPPGRGGDAPPGGSVQSEQVPGGESLTGPAIPGSDNGGGAVPPPQGTTPGGYLPPPPQRMPSGVSDGPDGPVGSGPGGPGPGSGLGLVGAPDRGIGSGGPGGQGVGGRGPGPGAGPGAGLGGRSGVAPFSGGAAGDATGVRGGSGAGKGGPVGMPVGAGAGKGRGGDDEEHQPKVQVMPDPDETFGTDEVTAPSVIQ